MKNDTATINVSSKVLLLPLLVLPANGVDQPAPLAEGCYVCRLNDHHDQILLCEHCNGEYHTYCLQPPLSSVPDNDWYCDNCIKFDPLRKHMISNPRNDCSNTGLLQLDDGLDRQVAALPYSITKRFNEIVFAQGGTGYGWWPCQIYDPRMAIDPNVRLQAQKYLHCRYLVYFFNCTGINTENGCNSKGFGVTVTSQSNTSNGTTGNCSIPNSSTGSATGTATPFSILEPKKMIKSWITGLSEDLYFGRAAKNHGKQRYRSFCDAFQLACIEYDKQSLNRNQHNRFILETFVYPKLNTATKQNDISKNSKGDRYITLSTPLSQEKLQQREPFLLQSPTTHHPSPETASQHVSRDTKPSQVKKRRESSKKKTRKRKQEEEIHWIRISSPYRNRKSKNSLTDNVCNGKNNDDDQPHPAFAPVNLSSTHTGNDASSLSSMPALRSPSAVEIACDESLTRSTKTIQNFSPTYYIDNHTMGNKSKLNVKREETLKSCHPIGKHPKKGYKNRLISTNDETLISSIVAEASTETVEEHPYPGDQTKNKRGRSRKLNLSLLRNEPSVTQNIPLVPPIASTAISAVVKRLNIMKRPQGRPRKNIVESSDFIPTKGPAPKKKLGRPKKFTTESLSIELTVTASSKKKQYRPKKPIFETSSIGALPKAISSKKKIGRPKKG